MTLSGNLQLAHGIFAGVMLGGVRYLNALSWQEQKLASNLMLACFALVIISSYAKKEIFNWYNLIYMFLAVGGGIYYLQQQPLEK